jgi:nucleoside-diphosphate-sugar epimerase
MAIALTGATGFVGRAVLRELIAAGHYPACLRRGTANSLPDPMLREVTGDLHDNDALFSLMQGTDTVIHVAGAVSARNDAAFFHTNLEGTRNVVAAARQAGVRRFIHISSLAARHPELSAYAASKEAAERIVLAESDNLSVLIFRPPAIYGPGDLATLPLLKELLKATAAIPGTPVAMFSMLHVDDFATIIRDAVAHDAMGILEIDDMDGPHSWHQLSSITQDAFARPHRMIFIPQTLAMVVGKTVETLAWWRGKSAMVTTGKMRELYFPDWVAKGPGWQRPNPIRLAQGLVQTIQWYGNAGWICLPSGKGH